MYGWPTNDTGLQDMYGGPTNDTGLDSMLGWQNTTNDTLPRYVVPSQTLVRQVSPRFDDLPEPQYSIAGSPPYQSPVTPPRLHQPEAMLPPHPWSLPYSNELSDNSQFFGTWGSGDEYKASYEGSPGAQFKNPFKAQAPSQYQCEASGCGERFQSTDKLNRHTRNWHHPYGRKRIKVKKKPLLPRPSKPPSSL
jgi:hypothetical protein